MDQAKLQHAVGYQFSDPELLAQALTHRSFGVPHNERLEFLGDGVLNCVIAAEVFERFDKFTEGELSRVRASLVRQDALYQIAKKLSLGDHLRLGEGELRNGGCSRPSILADALEALIGGIFVDGGFDSAGAVVRRLYEPLLSDLDAGSPEKDPKTLLQELLQARHLPLPHYAVVAIQGAAHNQRFNVECVIQELAIRTEGSGTSRRHAEQQAALRAFEQIRR
jgi:ribonuclease-3